MSNNRIIGYDFARSIALLGMVFISYWGLMNRYMEDVDPSGWVLFFIKTIEGRPAVMFVTLAGMGLYLLSRAAYESHDARKVSENRKTLVKRALFLFFVGMLNCLITPHDILHFYAVYFILAVYLIPASDRQLWAIISVVIMVFAVFMLMIHFKRGDEWDSIKPMDLWYVRGILYHLFFCGTYPVFPWIGFLFIGIWLGRHDLTNRHFRRKVLFASIAAVIVSEILSLIFYRKLLFEWRITWFIRLHIIHWFESVIPWFKSESFIPMFKIDPWEPLPLFFFSGAGSAVIAICLCVMLTEKLRNAKWLLPFVAVGQTTLTVYLAHTIIGRAAIMIMNRMGIESPLFPFWGAILFFAAALLFSYQWNRRFKRGPLELLMRHYLGFSIRLTVSGVHPINLEKK